MGSTERRRRRLPAGLVAVAVPVLLLTGGCATATPVGSSTAQDRVGSCKDKTTAEEVIGVSDTSPNVDCSTPHVFETYYVGPVPAALAKLGPRRPGPEILTGPAGASCPLTPLRPYLGAGPLDNQWGVSVFIKFPTRAEWAAGSRSMVCDLITSAAPNTVPRLQIPLRNIMQYRDSARVRLCRDGNADATLLTCDQWHTGERVGSVSATESAAARQADCSALTQLYVGGPVPTGYAAAVFVPPAAGSTPECWLSIRHGRALGTLRAGLEAR